MRGLGPLCYEAQRGLYVHPTYAVSVQREPLGILNAWNWAREFKDEDGERGGICESVRWVESYEQDEWHAAFILNKKPIPEQIPTLNTVVRLIAQRGGFLGRKGDSEPGARTLWQGVREIAVFVDGLRYARSIAAA